ncbi:hypothetical protein [Methanohalophilus portucalensis]|uniref:Uncharacterized protein n=2 Tax=Methanohalophilus portucalensis TaxID=39664 RepID=A0A1L9C6E9_9EURY|nr:hypothetical protein [Methanohalophilus portucalensis]ATU08707.1 hypothetical protein BKM01_07940 [Methanohalophilus portucalensis]OJH50095.1 hypothetical protein MPF_0890 [Methanohalophilus portucalensis FDF-1]RNI13119.1 hypothetical protein EFE41_00570 [Methanohalophilus portucalensis FDF-1]SMH31440.1 hypothetical protein SAMN06264941_0458 [Methanohalophilus portucalensis FDF-1]
MTTKLTTCTSGSNSTNADLEVTASLYEREDGSRYIEATQVWCVAQISGIVLESGNTFFYCVPEA